MNEQKILKIVIFLGYFTLSGGGMILWLKTLFRKRRDEVERLFTGRNIILQHNFTHFYGLESLGYFQIRGNGVLVLTSEQLYFLNALPRRELIIPIESITAIKNPRSHLGKSNIVKLLRVEFTTKSGSKDAVAWMVGRDVEAWTEAVERIRRVKHENPR